MLVSVMVGENSSENEALREIGAVYRCSALRPLTLAEPHVEEVISAELPWHDLFSGLPPLQPFHREKKSLLGSMVANAWMLQEGMGEGQLRIDELNGLKVYGMQAKVKEPVGR